MFERHMLYPVFAVMARKKLSQHLCFDNCLFLCPYARELTRRISLRFYQRLFPFVHYTVYQLSVCLPYTFYIYSYRFFAHGNRYSFLAVADRKVRSVLQIWFPMFII